MHGPSPILSIYNRSDSGILGREYTMICCDIKIVIEKMSYLSCIGPLKAGSNFLGSPIKYTRQTELVNGLPLTRDV